MKHDSVSIIKQQLKMLLLQTIKICIILHTGVVAYLSFSYKQMPLNWVHRFLQVDLSTYF